jgi:hypothetical protein
MKDRIFHILSLRVNFAASFSDILILDTHRWNILLTICLCILNEVSGFDINEIMFAVTNIAVKIPVSHWLLQDSGAIPLGASVKTNIPHNITV